MPNPNPQQVILALAAQLTNMMIERDEALMKNADLERALAEQQKGAEVIPHQTP